MSFFNRCKHEYDPRDAVYTYTPPVKDKLEGNFTAEEFQMYTMGITNISQACELCGEVNVKQYVGKVLATTEV